MTVARSLLWILLAQSLCHVAHAMPKPEAMIANPPCVEEMIIRREFEDHRKAFFLVRACGGDFVVKMSDSEDSLSRKVLVKGDDIAGRSGNVLWASLNEFADLKVFDLTSSVGTNATVVQHRKLTTTLADHCSRLGRSLLTFGLELPLEEEVVWKDGRFSFKDGEGLCSGRIDLKEALNDEAEFTTQYEIQRPNAENLSYQCRGVIDEKTQIAKSFELFEVHRGGEKRLIGRADVLRVQLSKSKVEPSLFTYQANIIGGVRNVHIPEGDKLLARSINEETSSGRAVVFWGRTISPTTSRFIIVAFFALTTAITVCVILMKKAGGKTMTKNKQL